MLEDKDTPENLTELQAAVVESYRQKLAKHLPCVEILGVFATDRIIEVKLNDVVLRDYSTLHRATKLSIQVGDRFNVTLLPCTIPYGIETHQQKNTKENLTELQAAVVEAYRRKLAKKLPEVEILDVFATDRIIEVKLNDASMRDLATSDRVIKLAIEVEDQFNVTLLPCIIPHDD